MGLAALFGGLCEAEVVDDGLAFEPSTVRVGLIREDQEYGGFRVKLQARLTAARISLQVDVGVGDAVKAAADENSRMKDFFDVWVLSREFAFKGDWLASAIGATFGPRRTAILPRCRPRSGRRSQEPPLFHVVLGLVAGFLLPRRRGSAYREPANIGQRAGGGGSRAECAGLSDRRLPTRTVLAQPA